MICQNCGKQIPENAKFCNHCGVVQISGSAQSAQQKKQTDEQAKQSSQRQQINSTIDEKAFKQYIMPTTCRNIFIVLCVFTIMCLFAAPPITVGYAGFAACFGIPWAIGYKRVTKQISSAQANGTYEKMLQEFATSKSILDGKVRYSENYVFGRKSGRFLNYGDIYWVYRHTTRYIVIPIISLAKIGDRTGKVFSFCRLKLTDRAGSEEIKALATIIHAKNPKAILGFDAERQKEYLRRTK